MYTQKAFFFKERTEEQKTFAILSYFKNDHDLKKINIYNSTPITLAVKVITLPNST
jgi:hypothetical protein